MARLDESEVMSFTVFKMEPECLTYSVRVTDQYRPDQPEYLEQLHVLRGVLEAHTEKSEQENLNARVNQYREVRSQLFDERLAKEITDGDSGPEGGE